MPKDYYFILGITRGADLNQIKKAYREVAKRHHPDITKSSNTKKFREIKEAYETLSDDRLRRQYDQGMEKRTVSVPVQQNPSPLRGRAFTDDTTRHGSALEAFLEGLLPGLYMRPERRGTMPKDLYYEVVLSHREAHQGGLFPITIPVVEDCPYCDRHTLWPGFGCPVCHDQGSVQTRRQFSLSIPPRTPEGTRVALPLEDLGVNDVRLHILVHVDPSLDDDLF